MRTLCLSRARFSGLPLVPVHHAFLHYEHDALRLFYISQRIAWNGHDVRELTSFERADLVLKSKQLGGHRRSCAKRLSRRHAIGRHEHKLERVISMRVDGGVCSERDLYA